MHNVDIVPGNKALVFLISKNKRKGGLEDGGRKASKGSSDGNF